MSVSLTSHDYREMCDFCRKPVKRAPGGGLFAGGVCTISDASRLSSYRPKAKRALKFYNKSKSKSFKLKKVYKVNCHGSRYQYMTFSAQEVGSEERNLFRGVVRGRDQVLFCEIKEDDKITLPSDFDRDVSSDEDGTHPHASKNDLGDGSKADSGGAERG